MARNSKNDIDWNNEWNYPIQWIEESWFARQLYMMLCYRVNLAMEGKPYKNLYQEETMSLMKGLNPEEQSLLGAYCKKIPEGGSFCLLQAVNTVANQMATGVDSYECTINDPYGYVKASTADLLAAKCSEDYIENELELAAPTYSKDLYRYGMVGVLVKYNAKEDNNVIMRIRPQNIWFDTMFSATGQKRFTGYSTMIPWSQLKKMIQDDGDELNTELRVPSKSMLSDDKKQVLKAKYSDKKIKTLNDLDIYVDDMNRLAASSELAGSNSVWWDYTHDLGMCYNLDYYRSFATDPKAKTKSGYHGQDVELTVMYDLNRKIEFKIINRRFVISMNKKAFRRKIAFPIHNPITDEVTDRIDEVALDCPLKVKYYEMDEMDKYPYPTSPVMKVLDQHDELCSLRAKRKHVSDILSILRINTNGADAEVLKKVMNVMGVTLDSLQGDVTSLNFQYSYDSIDSQIAHYEDSIKKTLCAYTEFDAMQAMGDRASAAESGMAIGAISQGLCSHQNIIMSLYADIAKQCLMNRVVYSPRQEFPVNNLGQYSTLTIQELALTSIINVKPKLAKKVHEKMLAQNALALIPILSKMGASQESIGYFIEQAMYGNVSRQIASTFVNPKGPSAEEVANAQLQAQNQANMLLQNQEMYEQNPLPYEAQAVAENTSPQEFSEVLSTLNTGNGLEEVSDEELMTDLGEGGDSMGIESVVTNQEDMGMAIPGMEGMSPEFASDMANAAGYGG